MEGNNAKLFNMDSMSYLQTAGYHSLCSCFVVIASSAMLIGWAKLEFSYRLQSDAGTSVLRDYYRFENVARRSSVSECLDSSQSRPNDS